MKRMVWVEPATGFVVRFFNWDEVSPLIETSFKVEEYAQDVHPPLGYPVTAGPDWQNRYQEFLGTDLVFTFPVVNDLTPSDKQAFDYACQQVSLHINQLKGGQ